MLNGVTANLPADTLFGLGVVYKGATKVGVTRGAPRWDPGKEIRNTPYDGKVSDVQGLDRVISWAPVLAFTLIELGTSATGKQLALVEPGSVEGVADEDGTQVVTPRDAEEYFAEGEYSNDVRVIWRKSGGGYVALHLPIALCTKYDLQGEEKDEARIAVEFRPRISETDAQNDPGKCPFRYEHRTALPTA